MGRPLPCVLFAQSFVHPQLDDHVDEVVFAEPVVISACEILEHNSSSISQAVSLVGSTLPSSFALEIFVQCEGEARFRRLCQPFLYSHSSSNVLEIEAVVTNHLVIRGSYRSLSLIVYGNTAEDLGQFNIEFDDSSLSNLVTSDANLEDLPFALYSVSRTVEEPLAPLSTLSLPIPELDVPVVVRKFLYLLLKTIGYSCLQEPLHRVVSAVVDATSSYIRRISCKEVENQNCARKGVSELHEEISHALGGKKDDLNDILWQLLKEKEVDVPMLDSDDDIALSKDLVGTINQYFCFDQGSILEHLQLPQKENVLWGLSVALLLCTSKESLHHFVIGGGMQQLAHVFSDDLLNSSAVLLLLLGVIVQATHHAIGCENLLGWSPRKYTNIPSGSSDIYNNLLNLCLQRERHDVASFATFLLHRLRFYEIASRYESDALSLIGDSGADEKIDASGLLSLNSQLCKLLKMINIRGPVENPSPSAQASRLLILGQPDSLLSYGSTSSLICSSSSSWDVDPHLLLLLKERGFLPLSAALLSSSYVRSNEGYEVQTFFSIASNIAAILLSLLTCRSGLIFLSHDPELATIVIDALRGVNELKNEECMPRSYISAMISNGFVCNLREVGTILEIHLRVVNALDRLLTSTPYSEEFLWILWELCGLSRSDCGRQALLILVHFPEAITILIEALHSFKESEPELNINATSPINLATFHSAAEIFEIIVTDSAASSLNLWIGHAMELHEALNFSTPGSIRKDAPTRLLELVDAGVVYHKNGVVGLLRYSAVLSCGDDANWSSSSVLANDTNDVEVMNTDVSGGSDVNVLDNLGKIISEKAFDGVALRDSSIVQLTTAVRILAFVSENSTVSAALYDEGAVTVVCAILLNCSYMLERSSNNYDYLVDDCTEANSTSDLLLERNLEQSIIDLIIPSLVLLINLLKKLKDSKEQHRNTRLMNALLRLHREVSPRLAASAGHVSASYSGFALGFGSISHLVVSALTCWPVYMWTPGLFDILLANVQSSSILTLGPKETCSLFCILNDLFPEEDIWLWENGMPLLSGVRKLAVQTLLGTQKENQISWYLKPTHSDVLLGHLLPHLDSVAEIIQHYAISALVVIQDMLRVFIIRIACLKPEHASALLQRLLASIHSSVSNASFDSELEVYKVYKYLDFLSSLLEHPRGKALLLELDVVKILVGVLDRSFSVAEWDDRQDLECKSSPECGFTVRMWCLAVFKCLSLLCWSRRKRHEGAPLSINDCSFILPYVLRFLEALPAGNELLHCAQLFKNLASCCEGRSALEDKFCSAISRPGEADGENQCETAPNDSNTDAAQLNNRPPLLGCWLHLLKAIDSNDVVSDPIVETVISLCVACIRFCYHDSRISFDALNTVKGFFGNVSPIEDMAACLASSPAASSRMSQAVKSLAFLLSASPETVSEERLEVVLSWMDDVEDASLEKFDGGFSSELGEKFLWECPVPDRLTQTTAGKRKMSTLDHTAKRVKADAAVSDASAQNAFPRNQTSTALAGQTRRDTFRQRKPNTSRPPSMHVDDYVARERSVDAGNSNVIAVQRIGTSGGRPPSIHVDEFMARQRERQNPSPTIAGGGSTQVKADASGSSDARDAAEKSKPLKTDLDDDLHGIDIVFDGEESESDDKLPFPQPDDILQPSASVAVEKKSPLSFGEDAEIDAMPVSYSVEESAPTDLSSVNSISRPDIPPNRKSNPPEKKFFEQSDDLNSVIPARHPAGASSYPPFLSAQLPPDNRMNHLGFFTKHSPQQPSPSRAPYDQRFSMNQPPLPPNPPPSTYSPAAYGNASSSLPLRTSMSSPSPSGSAHPPLPPMPPPFSSNAYQQIISKTSSSMYNATAGDHPQVSSFPGPPMALSRPSPSPNQQAESLPNVPILPAAHQLRPLQPPFQRRPQLSQHGWSTLHPSQQAEQMHVAAHPHQMLQNPLAHHEQTEFPQPQSATTPQADPASLHQSDVGMPLHEYFKDPMAIASLLSNKEELCRLLEQHPKLMQMLQERLGHQ